VPSQGTTWFAYAIVPALTGFILCCVLQLILQICPLKRSEYSLLEFFWILQILFHLLYLQVVGDTNVHGKHFKKYNENITYRLKHLKSQLIRLKMNNYIIFCFICVFHFLVCICIIFWISLLLLIIYWFCFLKFFHYELFVLHFY
jgi:hypothetical protein